MKSIKYLVVLVCMTFGLVNVAKAQVYSHETYIYEDTSGDDWYILLELDGNKAYMDACKGNGYRQHAIKTGYKNSSSWANDKNKDRIFTFDASMSSKYSKNVYRRNESGGWKDFFSITDDMNTVITWKETPEGEIVSYHTTWGTTTWVRVDLDIFKPQSESEKYEFLND